LTRLAGTTGSADSVDVVVAALRQTDLDDVRDIGEVHASGCHVGGEQDGGLAGAEALGLAGSLALLEFAVHLEDAAGVEGVGGEDAAGLVWVAHFGEGFEGHCNLGGAAEVDDGFEGWVVLWVFFVCIDGFICDLHDDWDLVLQALAEDDVLRDALVGRGLVWVDSADEFEVGSQGGADELDDGFGDGGAEHEGLAGGSAVGGQLRRVGHVGGDVGDGRSETNVEQTVSFIQDEGLDVAESDAGAAVGDDVEDSTWGADHDVAALVLHFA